MKVDAAMVRNGLTSYGTVGIAWAAMTALHGRWLWRSSHAGDVLSAYGAGLVVLGLWVAVLELMRIGIAETARRQAENHSIWFAEQLSAAQDAQTASELQARRALLIERIVAGLIAAAGTFLSGWGTPLARRWGLPV